MNAKTTDAGGYRIILAKKEHVAALPAIERAAATCFGEADLPSALRGKTVSVEDHFAAVELGHLCVALSIMNEPVGFALVSVNDKKDVHLDEMDVDPAHARQGIGRALVGAVCDWAQGQGYPSITLTTFRHLAWNAPFYERLGFVGLEEDELTPRLRAMLHADAELGLDPHNRIAMRFDLTL